MNEKVRRILGSGGPATAREEVGDSPEHVQRLSHMPQLMLELRRRNGCRVGLPYAYLVEVDLQYPADDEVHIVLLYSGKRVTIRGRNLGPIFDGLMRHSVRVLEESPSEFDTDPEVVTVIREIAVEELA